MYTKRRNIIELDMVKQNIIPFIHSISKQQSRRLYETYLPKILNVGEITPENINKYLHSMDLAETSKQTVRGMWVSFLNWMVRSYGVRFDTRSIKPFTYAPKLKSFYTEQQKEELKKMVHQYGNKKFELYFHILEYNGCRLSETLEFDLLELYKNGEVQITAKKGGVKRLIFANETILRLLEVVDLTHWKLQTLTNTYNLFKKFVKKINPQWNLDIKASQLRTQWINTAAHKRLTSSEIRIITGHSTTDVIEKSYIRTDIHNIRKTFKRSTMPEFYALSEKQKEINFDLQNDQIEALKRELELEKQKTKLSKLEAYNEFINMGSDIYQKKLDKYLVNVYNIIVNGNKTEYVLNKKEENNQTENMEIVQWKN